jgi:hypothetical protein
MSTKDMVAEFTPISGLSFRDARPFQPGEGESHFAQGIPFPPHPEAFWSALRLLLPKMGNGTTREQHLRLTGFSVATGRQPADKGSEPFFPAPADFFEWSSDSNLDLTEGCAVLSPLPEARPDREPVVWISRMGGKARPVEETFLPTGVFKRYLLGELERAGSPPGVQRMRDPNPTRRLIVSDRRIGVQMDVEKMNGRKVKSGGLYSAPLILPDLDKNTHFRATVRMPADAAVEGGHVVRLGGEGRLAHLALRKQTQADSWFGAGTRKDVVNAILKAKPAGPPYRVKMVLLTPAVFSAHMDILATPGFRTPAWKPFWLRGPVEWSRPVFSPQPYRVRLVAAVTGKPFALGAWDTRGDEMGDGDVNGEFHGARPRPLHRCLPAGAVYLLEVEPATPNGETVDAGYALDRFFDDFWLQTLLVRALPARRQGQESSPGGPADRPLNHHGMRGFGWTALGVWNYVEFK